MIFPVEPLSLGRHRELNWAPASRFPFADGQIALPIARSEARELSAQAPILLRRAGGELVPVIILKPDWCETPVFDAEMRWLSGSAPLALRYHPFHLLDDASGPGLCVLGVASDRNVVSPGQPHAFFDEDGQTAPLVQAVFKQLLRIRLERIQLAAAAAALLQAGVLTRIPLSDARGRRPFYALDAARFEALDRAALARMGERPQDAWMLAAVLAYSRSRHLIERHDGGRQDPDSSDNERSPSATPPFLVDDDDGMAFEF